jgi:transcriptional antiterminator RfaH
MAAPLFPRDISVAIGVAVHRWRSIQSTIGVVCLVRNGDHPAEVPNAVIGGLRPGQDERGSVRLERLPTFHVGDKIHVIDGVAC